jgi:hypothetical protein
LDSTIIVEVMCKALPDITMDEVKQLQAVVAGEVHASRAALTCPWTQLPQTHYRLT